MYNIISVVDFIILVLCDGNALFPFLRLLYYSQHYPIVMFFLFSLFFQTRRPADRSGYNGPFCSIEMKEEEDLQTAIRRSLNPTPARPKVSRSQAATAANAAGGSGSKQDEAETYSKFRLEAPKNRKPEFDEEFLANLEYVDEINLYPLLRILLFLLLFPFTNFNKFSRFPVFPILLISFFSSQTSSG